MGNMSSSTSTYLPTEVASFKRYTFWVKKKGKRNLKVFNELK